MDVAFLPTLGVFRELYARPRDRARFRAYIWQLTGGTGDVVLPIVAANPMAKGHALDTLAALEAVRAEEVAAAAAGEAARRLAAVDARLRVALVVVDDVAGGWTNRHMTDAAHRIQCLDEVKRGFASVYCWTSEAARAERIREETTAAIYRALYVRRYGVPRTLGEALEQEGLVAAFAAATWPVLPCEEIERARGVLDARRASSHYPTIFACMYGDEPARKAGYDAVGVAEWAGLAVARDEERRRARRPESLLGD
jgi:hypothetical protein